MIQNLLGYSLLATWHKLVIVEAQWFIVVPALRNLFHKWNRIDEIFVLYQEKDINVIGIWNLG